MDIKLTYAGKFELGVLKALLRQRMEAMRETSKQAVSAIAVDILKSLRTRTTIARRVKNYGIEETGLYGSFETQSSKRSRCLRIGFLKNSPKFNPDYPVIYKDLPTSKPSLRRVWLVHPENGRTPYYLVCESMKQAKSIVKEHTLKRIKMYGGLAYHMLGIAMARIAAETIGSRLFTGTVYQSMFGNLDTDGNDSSFRIKYTSGLDYSVDALKNGKSDVSISLQAALNKVSSTIHQSLKDKGLQDKYEPPFPNIRKRK